MSVGPTAQASDLGAVAVDLALLGWHVFPLKPRAKIPATDNGFKAATDDEGRVRAWWERNPQCNVGIATGASRLLVVDLDTGGAGHCGDALAALCALAHERGELPDTYEVATPSGGEHWYYRLPEGATAPSSAGRLGSHIDVRADGGYVVAAGSTLQFGNYTTAADAPVEDAPEWLIEACQRRNAKVIDVELPSTDRYERYVATALDAECGAVALAPVGTRNDTLNTAAYNVGQLVGGGMLDNTDALNHLLAAAQRAGLGEVEAERTILSGLLAGVRNPRRPE